MIVPHVKLSVLLCLNFVTILLIGIVDWAVGPQIMLSIFYFIPICLSTWYDGRTDGLVMSIIASLVRYFSEVAGAFHVSSYLIEVWNVMAGEVAFMVVILLLARVKNMSLQLEKKVAERTSDLVQEVAERKRAEEALRTLAAQLSDAEEAERMRLAADIHDSVGQSLSVLKMNLGLSARALSTNGQSTQDLSASLHLIDDIVRQIRTFTFNLHPAMIEELGLVPTLHWYAEQFGKQTGVQVAVTEQGERRPLSNSTAAYLFRAVKELLNNAAKHGKAGEIICGIHWRSDGVRLVIDDDGCGFDVAAPPHQGLGLAGIRERLIALNGRLEIESAPGQGTRIILNFVLQ
jgi:signal transduction histidine kinase